MARDALEHVGYISWQNALMSSVSTVVMQRHNSLHMLSWLVSSGYTWNDLHGIGPRPAQDLVQTNFSKKIRFKIWTVYEEGMRYEHFKRERVLHNDMIEIVPNPKHFGVVLQSTLLTNCKQAPTPSVVGFVKQKFDDGAVLDTQERRVCRGIVGSLQYLSIDCCNLHFETCLCEGDEATDRSFMDTIETIGPIFGKGPVRVLFTLEQTMFRMVHFLRVWSDSDSGGNVKDRRSHSSLKIEIDGCPLYSASSKQKSREHSNGGVEYFVAASATNEAMLIREVLLFTGLEVLTELLLNSAAARGRCRREGNGTIRHLSRQVLWLQHLAKREVVTVGACVHPQRTAQIWRTSLFVRIFRQLMQWNGLVLDRHEKSVYSDTEDGQDENDQRGIAVQTICDIRQGDGGVLDALGN